MNNIERQRRAIDALCAKAEHFGWDLDQPSPDGIGTLRDIVTTLLVDMEMIVAGLVSVERYEVDDQI